MIRSLVVLNMRLTIKDYELVNRIMSHPKIYPMMIDDHADPDHKELGSFLLMQPTIWMLHPADHILFMGVPRTMTVYECHTMIEPEGRGKSAIQSGIDAARYLFENSTCEKIITYVPFFNKRARIFAKVVGFKDEGVCTRSFKKDNILHDQWVLGLEKEAICQQ